MVQKARTDHIYSRAYQLAASGLHLEPITIVSALINEGYPEAAEVLASPLIRKDLRLVCTRNWPGNVPATTVDDQASAELDRAQPPAWPSNDSNPWQKR